MVGWTLYSSVRGALPQARYVKGPTLLESVRSAVEQKGAWELELAGARVLAS